MSEANNTPVQNSSILGQLATVKSPSVWDDVKESSRAGLNLGVTLGVAVAIVTVVCVAGSYLPRGDVKAS